MLSLRPTKKGYDVIEDGELTEYTINKFSGRSMIANKGGKALTDCVSLERCMKSIQEDNSGNSEKAIKFVDDRIVNFNKEDVC